MKKLLIIQVAALGHGLLEKAGKLHLGELTFQPARSVLPALTCTVQGSFRTASPPGEHGMVANGLFVRPLGRPMFWEQSCRLVAGPRIWEGFRSRGARVGMMFWQQSLGEDVDLIVSPAPIHKHGGGIIDDCYSRPSGLYDKLCRAVGRGFKLHQYWGPLASAKVGDWISAATSAILRDRELAPDVLLTYLPSLDYDLQRHGPDDARSARALDKTLGQLGVMVNAARQGGYEVLVFGDYAIAPASRAALPNRALLQAGLLRTREVRGMLYPDFHASKAFAMVDHEIAHIYVRDAADIPAAADVLGNLPGVEQVMDAQAQAGIGVGGPSSGELVLIASDGWWLAYPWWSGKSERPDYATHVDIHNKPGYDPCELFFGWPPPSVGQDPLRIRGSHGRVGPGRDVAVAGTLNLPELQARTDADLPTLIDIAAGVRRWLDE